MSKNVRWSVMVVATAFLSTSVSAAEEPSAAAFSQMKAMVGVWRQADKPDSTFRIRFSLTAGDTVIVEEWLRGTKPHSLTAYHHDGNALLATHYCPQGNQPRLVQLPTSGSGLIRFTFRDATNLDIARQSHLVALAFDVTQASSVTRSETYRTAGEDEASEMRLVRDLPQGVTTGPT